MRSRQYGADVLAGGTGRRRFGGPGQREVPTVAAERGLVVEDSEGRFCGAVVGYEKGAVTLEDRHGKRRVFPLTPAAFLLEGQPVTLVPPAPAAAPARTALNSGTTASGSVAAPAAVGIAAWPDVPRGQPWKEGVLRAVGWPPDVPAAWQRILRSVSSYADLEPELLGRVEELIDFVTMPGSA